ncbi:hypothetical protein [Paenibacillus sp. S-12]|uniref:hypothetical protein n=1 Tax=Paenibacillus sp. S-12 TaxID=3031371 RepID=UPI0025A2DBAC|nr:hypothetical protein [Paenibacillus sp. S-12]
MARIRLNFRSLTLFEDEEWGDTHMAMYATVRDSSGTPLAAFQWNNLGREVDETTTYSLAIDPANNNVIDVDLSSWATIQVSAFTHDDNAWPNSDDNENQLGSASKTIDSRVLSSLGTLTLGPTRTDNGNTGYLVTLEASLIAEPSPAEVRIQLDNLILYEDEEWGSTHMAIYMHAQAPEQNGRPAFHQEIFRWNNADKEVDEVNSYPLNNGLDSTTIRLTLNGPTVIWVEGYADDDRNWPSREGHENSLGQALITIDPSDLSTLGRRQLGPTSTDNDNTGYVINLMVDVLPPAGDGPSLSVIGLEVTQAIQHFASALGPDNSVPLVANKVTLVRAYLDSGLAAGGTIDNVTGTLTISGATYRTIQSIVPMTAKPASAINRANFSDTLNFIIPAEIANGTLNLTVQATVGGNFSAPIQTSVSFTAVKQLDILMIRIASNGVPAPSQASYFAAVNQLPLIYPIPTDPGQAIRYWIIPGSEVVMNTHDLNTDDGMHDLLDDLEDIQEETSEEKKAYALIPNNVSMRRFGTSRKWDNVALGCSYIMESVGHELGHLYGLDHAPCGTSGNYPKDTDDDFVPVNGLIGEVGVDVVGKVAFSPTVSDFMSYCGSLGLPYENQWISAYHWNKLFQNFRE